MNQSNLPKHVAIIMDGNGRWATEQGKDRVFGHQNGVNAVRESLEAALSLGISFVTLYAFSTENWARPQKEIDALMGLLSLTILQEIAELKKQDIRLNTIGDLSKLPEDTQRKLRQAIQETAENQKMTLTLALNYSARQEILEASKKIAQAVLDGVLDLTDLNEKKFEDYLSTVHLPDPDLLIRTSGEQRLSNFLLWQCAYTEFYFTATLWPDFVKTDFLEAVKAYQNRQRKFGAIL